MQVSSEAAKGAMGAMFGLGAQKGMAGVADHVDRLKGHSARTIGERLGGTRGSPGG